MLPRYKSCKIIRIVKWPLKQMNSIPPDSIIWGLSVIKSELISSYLNGTPEYIPSVWIKVYNSKQHTKSRSILYFCGRVWGEVRRHGFCRGLKNTTGNHTHTHAYLVSEICALSNIWNGTQIMHVLLWTRIKCHRSFMVYCGQELRTQIVNGLLWTRTKNTAHAGPTVDKN